MNFEDSACIQTLFPTVGHVSPRDVVAQAQSGPLLLPFAEELIEAVARVAQGLQRKFTRHAEIQALAYWLRRAELRKLADHFLRETPASTVRVPRGLVFHLPPSNVDTLFAYTWMLAALTGNRNIVRISERTLSRSQPLITSILEALAEWPSVSTNNVVVSYGHSQEVTASISHASDLRVIWGGDLTVNSIRATGLAPQARNLSFPDRSSIAAIRTDAYAELDDANRDVLVERFFNDAYWFDQRGCASPRALIWVGKEARHSEESDFFTRLGRIVAQKKYETATVSAMEKMTYLYDKAAQNEITSIRWNSNEVAVGESSHFPDVRGEFYGTGVFITTRIDTLHDMIHNVERTDQTLAVFGFTNGELTEFVQALRGRGIDRIVPIGQALTFHRIWDGYDLLTELTRFVYVQGSDS